MTMHPYICRLLTTVLFAVVLFGAGTSYAVAGTEPLMGGLPALVESVSQAIALGTEPLMGATQVA